MKTLIRIVSRDARGRPKSCEIFHDDEHINITGGEHFLTAEIDADVLDPAAAQKAKEDAADQRKPRRR